VKSKSKDLRHRAQSRSRERRKGQSQRQLQQIEHRVHRVTPGEHGERRALLYFVVVVVFSFKTRTRMRPSEWKLPPVAVLASMTGSDGVT
jgi:hypothetical protein